MFSYAIARRIQLLNPEQKIGLDFSHFEHIDNTWINYLEKFKCINNINVEKRKLNVIQRTILYFYIKKRNKVQGWNNIRTFEKKYAAILEIFGIYWFSVGYFKFKYKSLFKNKIVLGFYESSKYFDCIKDIICDDFKVNGVSENRCVEKIVKDIEENISIALGVRRGDFLSQRNKKFCDVCSPQYYERALEIVVQSIENKAKIKVYCFSDDISWAKKSIKCEFPIVYITSSIEGELKPWEMVHIMSKCNYYIISNSSYFWWAQYLSENPQMVIAPSRWRNDCIDEFCDIYMDNWMCIDPD